jgi:hypothetical protein
MSGSRAPEGAAPAEAAGGVRFVDVEVLRTTMSPLRPGAPQRAVDGLCELPLRVVATDDGHFEVIDGFKRLARWRETPGRLVPVLVEPAGTTADHKRRLLLANAPRRTITALDEARVVSSLVADDGMTPRAVGRLLGHKPDWVARRLSLVRHLGPTATAKLAHGEFGPTLAHALTTMSPDDQDAVLAAGAAHGLREREVLALAHNYRVADEVDRRDLLRSPLASLRPDPPPVSPRAAALEKRLEDFQRELVDLRSFALPDDLPPAERRRLDALLRGVYQQLGETARATTNESTPTTKEELREPDAAPHDPSPVLDVQQPDERDAPQDPLALSGEPQPTEDCLRAGDPQGARVSRPGGGRLLRPVRGRECPHGVRPDSQRFVGGDVAAPA